MNISVSEVIWTVIDFIVLMLLLNHFLYKPIVHKMDERKKKIDEGLQVGTDAQKKLQDNEAQLQKELVQRRSEAKQLLSNARAEDVNSGKLAHKQAAALAEQQKQEIRAKIAQEKAQLDGQIKKQMPELVAVLAGHILQNDDAPRQNMDAIRDSIAQNQAVS